MMTIAKINRLARARDTAKWRVRVAREQATARVEAGSWTEERAEEHVRETELRLTEAEGALFIARWRLRAGE